MEARVTRLVNVFNYANVVVKEQLELPVFFLFIDRCERPDEMQFDTIPFFEWELSWPIEFPTGHDFHTFHW